MARAIGQLALAGGARRGLVRNAETGVEGAVGGGRAVWHGKEV